MMLGLLLARAGVSVLVLEKHADFLRDFRGDDFLSQHARGHDSFTLWMQAEVTLLGEDAWSAFPSRST